MAKVGDACDRVAPRGERGLAMGVAAVHTDATARGDVGPFPSLEEFFDNDLALHVHDVFPVIAKDVMESVEVVLGMRHSWRERVVLAMVVPGEGAVASRVGESACRSRRQVSGRDQSRVVRYSRMPTPLTLH